MHHYRLFDCTIHLGVHEWGRSWIAQVTVAVRTPIENDVLGLKPFEASLPWFW